MKQDIISFMFNVKDTSTESMFIMHFGKQQLNREINYIQFAYEILYIIMKIWPRITPIMKIIFQHSVPTATH